MLKRVRETKQQKVSFDVYFKVFNAMIHAKVFIIGENNSFDKRGERERASRLMVLKC